MPTEIGKLHVKLGYVTAIDFFNSESANPTPGMHDWFVQHLFNTIAVSDFWFFVTELYENETDYWGVFIAFAEGILVVDKDLVPTYCIVNAGQVASLLQVDESNGLQEFYSNEVVLTDLTGQSLFRYVQIYNHVEFGNERWFLRIKDNSVTYQNGVINARTTLDSVLGSYNVKVDPLPYALIVCTSAQNQYTQFQVQITDTYYTELSYKTRGQKLYVQDTPISRKRLKELTLKGVIFADV